MEHRMIRRVTFCAAIAVLATACSGDDDTTSMSTTTPSPAAATDDTAETTAARPTAPSTSTTTTTSVDPTTSAPTTTESDDRTTSTTADTQPNDDDLHQAVIDAVIESWRVFNEAKLDPTDDDKVAALSEYTGGDLLVNSVEVIARYRAENKRSVTNPDVPAEIVVYADTVTIDQAAGTAQVDYCRIGSNILVEVGGNADGSDLVLDDTVNTYIERSFLALEDGRWLDTGGVELEFLEGATSCPERD